MYPEFLEVQDHIWGYGLMFSGLFIAFTIWKYGWKIWKEKVAAGEADETLRGYMAHGMPAFRDDFINTGDNDLWVGSWWDKIMYFGFPIMFSVLILSYFSDLIFSFDPWYSAFNPVDPKGAGIIFAFWGVVGVTFFFFNKKLTSYPLYRNIPEGAEVDISTLPGADDEMIFVLGEDSTDKIFDAEIVE